MFNKGERKLHWIMNIEYRSTISLIFCPLLMSNKSKNMHSKKLYLWTGTFSVSWIYTVFCFCRCFKKIRNAQILPCTLAIELGGLIFLMSWSWKVGLRTCITLPYLNSKGKIMERGCILRFLCRIPQTNTQVAKKDFYKLKKESNFTLKP